MNSRKRSNGLGLQMLTSAASNADANVQKSAFGPAPPFLISAPQSKLEQIALLGFYGNVKEALVLVILLVA